MIIPLATVKKIPMVLLKVEIKFGQEQEDNSGMHGEEMFFITIKCEFLTAFRIYMEYNFYKGTRMVKG